MALSNFYWDASKPIDSTLIPDGPQAWRYVIGNTEALLGGEHHTFPDDSNLGAYHQPGSAVLLTGTTRPTTRLDTSAFDINDNGRLFFDTDVEELEVLTDFSGPTWVSFGSLSAAHAWALPQTWTTGIVANNTALSARNAADDGNVEMIRVDGSDVVTLPDGVVATTQTVEDNSTKLATTAYADQAGIKAWIRFTGNGGVGAATKLAGSSNVTAAKTGTGTYTLTFSPAMTDANYVVSMTASKSGGATTMLVAVPDVSTPVHTNVTFNLVTVDLDKSFQDAVAVDVMIMGN